MKILINDKPLHFTLENEKNAFDVLSAISTWITEKNLVLCDIKVNGKSYPYPPLAESLKKLVIAELKEICCDMMNLSTLCAALSLGAGEELLKLAQNLNETSVTKHIEAISAKLTWIRHTLLHCASLLHLETSFLPIDQTLKILESDLYAISHKEKTFDREQITTSIQSVMTKLNDHFLTLQTRALAHDHSLFLATQKEGTASQEDLLSTSQSLRHEASLLMQTIERWTVKTATAFQQGDLAHSLAMLSDLTQAISLFLNIHQPSNPSHQPNNHPLEKIENSPGKTSYQEHLTKLENSLEQIATSLEAKDYVETSDLLEYEIIPLLRAFTENKSSPAPKISATKSIK